MENWVVRPFIKPGYRWILARFGEGESIDQSIDRGKQFKPDPPLHDSNMSTDHFFSLTPDILGPAIRSLNGRNGDNAQATSWSVGTSRWKIHPTADGLFRLEHDMSYATGTRIHCFLEKGEDGLLHCMQNANVNEPRQQFEIELWDSSKSYDPEAMSPEQRDLEGDNLYWNNPKKDEGTCVCKYDAGLLIVVFILMTINGRSRRHDDD